MALKKTRSKILRCAQNDSERVHDDSIAALCAASSAPGPACRGPKVSHASRQYAGADDHDHQSSETRHNKRDDSGLDSHGADAGAVQVRGIHVAIGDVKDARKPVVPTLV